MKPHVILFYLIAGFLGIFGHIIPDSQAAKNRDGNFYIHNEKSYHEIRDSINKFRKNLASAYLTSTQKSQKEETLQEARKHFINSITNCLYPLWEGTRWAFYGTSQIPKQGSIACGYFVTTLLEHAGVQLDRIGLAEIESETMIRKLVTKEHIKIYRNTKPEHFLQEVKLQGDGLYIIGLDFHTGFILCEKQQVYFIHSSFIGPVCVVKEPASASPILLSSRYRVTGKISDDPIFLEKWLLEKRF